MMKRSTVLSLLAAAIVLVISSCSGKGNSGPSGADGGYVLTFQTGVQPYTSYAGTTDTRIANGPYINSNFGATQNVITGSTSYPMKYRYLVRFDLSGVIPSTATVSKAYLTLYTGITIYGNFTLSAYRLTSSWDQGTALVYTDPADGATWNNKTTSAAWGTPGGDFNASAVSDAVTPAAGFEQPFTLELDASMVQSWLSSPANNYGVILIGSQESAAVDNYTTVYTAEFPTDPLKRPKLTVYLKP